MIVTGTLSPKAHPAIQAKFFNISIHPSNETCSEHKAKIHDTVGADQANQFYNPLLSLIFLKAPNKKPATMA
jgi:hypothetical protein